MKKLLLFLYTCISFYTLSQTYGNEWINYSQKYYTFPIAKTGIYKIDYTTLINNGIPLNSISPANFQVFGKQKEIPLYIIDGGDNSFDSGDYFLFYGEKNNGWLDSLLYNQPTDIGNPYYSLFNDTIQYFFTWNNSSNNLRFKDVDASNYLSYTPENYFISTLTNAYSDRYSDGKREDDLSSSFYQPGEGWGTNLYSKGATVSLIAKTTKLYTGIDAPLGEFTASTVTSSNSDFIGNGNHHQVWKIGTNNYILSDTVTIGRNQIYVKKKFPLAELIAGNTSVKMQILNDQGATTDYQVINYWEIKYPKKIDFEKATFCSYDLNPSSLQFQRLDIANVSSANCIVFCLGNTPQKLNLINKSGIYSTLVEGSTSSQKIIYSTTAQIINVTKFSAVNGTGDFTDFSTLNYEKSLLMVTHPKLDSVSNLYADYRKSTGGGNYNVVKVNINELYQQFGGGVTKHIFGIRRFVHYAYNHSTEKPIALYLVGKATSTSNVSINSVYQFSRKDVSAYSQNLIPTFGEPNSDIGIVNDLEGSGWKPLIPVGRISVSNQLDLANYFEKIKSYETQQSEQIYKTDDELDWQKQIIHLSGGSNDVQQNLFQGYLNSMEAIIEDTNFAGNVIKIYKKDSEPLDIDALSNVTQRLKNGVSLMNFFGHKSATVSGFEINIDDPSKWENKDRYPIVIANTCYNGDIFNTFQSSSELFVNTKDAGAIAFISPVYVGVAEILTEYTKELYRQFAFKNYQNTIGTQIQSTVDSIYQSYSNSLFFECLSSQMTLNGDPCLKINSFSKPEISISAEKIWFDEKKFDLNTPFITMNIEVSNLGKSIKDSIKIEVRRDFPKIKTDSVFTYYLPKLNYKDTLKVLIPLQPTISNGINDFYVTVDLPNYIPEQFDETNNNQVKKSLSINIDDIIPLFPNDYAIVPDDTLTLMASTLNPIAPLNSYKIELDTTDTYDSPQHRFAFITRNGGPIPIRSADWLDANNQSFPLIFTDSTVYFWRVALSNSSDWKEHSFQYIKNKEGWGQTHFFQFKNNNFTGIKYDHSLRTKSFFQVSRKISCVVKASNKAPYIYYNAYSIDDVQTDYTLCSMTPTIHVAVIDNKTFVPWGTRYLATNQNINNNFGNYNDNGGCLPRVMKYFAYYQDNSTSLANLQNLITNVVPDSFYILIYTPIAARFDLWNTYSPSMFTTLQNMGADSLYPSQTNRTMALLIQKGAPSKTKLTLANSPTDDVNFDAIVKSYKDNGIEISTMIGPAANWNTLYWKQKTIDPISNVDSTRLSITGYDWNGNSLKTIDTLFTNLDSITNLNQLFPAVQYPYLNLTADYFDKTNKTPSKIEHWQITYDQFPEAAIDNLVDYTWLPKKDTLSEGESIQFAIDIKNIYKLPMDSLLVKYWIEDANLVNHPIQYSRQDSLRVGATFRDTILISTVGLKDRCILHMEANPYISIGSTLTDQPEQYHFNNLVEIPFYVKGDEQNPILDVTFDNRHILNGDIISPNTIINISLKDENPYLIMDSDSDTSHFAIYLTAPNGKQERIYFKNPDGSSNLTWTPATAQNKRFKILYPGKFMQDGIYTLMVQGSDKSGNLSGAYQYKITFEIVNHSSISALMNYPNPFSTNTKFVFTLTGSEVPDKVLIQIMNISGKVVREITQDELGQIYIGRNITEFAWDGKDMYGDQLANGVYLYTVKAQINGKDIEHRSSEADQYMKKEFGKMYLLR